MVNINVLENKMTLLTEVIFLESISEDIVNTCQLSLPVFPLSSVVKEFNADFMLIILLYAKVSVIIEMKISN